MPDTALASSPTPHLPLENQSSVHRSSHVLELVAGPWAEQLSTLFDFPFNDLTERSSIWWHIAAISLSSPIASANNVRVIFDHIPCWKDAAWTACPSFDNSNVSILKKMPLPLWDRSVYRKLCRILRCDQAVKIMRHSDQVTPDLVEKIHDLPVQFRTKRITDIFVDPEEAKLIAKFFSQRSNDELVQLSNALNNTPDREHFWKKIRKNFFDQIDQLAIPPEISDPRVEPVTTFQRLQEVSADFKNCVAELYRNDCMAGEHAFYVFNGDQEKAVICVSPRIGSQPVITEVKGKNNSDPSSSTLKEIRQIFLSEGFKFQEEEPAAIYSQIDRHIHYLAAHDDPAGVRKRTGKMLDRLNKWNGMVTG